LLISYPALIFILLLVSVMCMFLYQFGQLSFIVKQSFQSLATVFLCVVDNDHLQFIFLVISL